MIKSHPGLKPLEEVDSEMSELIAQEQRRQACAPRPKPSFVERGGRARRIGTRRSTSNVAPYSALPGAPTRSMFHVATRTTSGATTRLARDERLTEGGCAEQATMRRAMSPREKRDMSPP